MNEEQRRAVESLDGPVLILAGAGVGKTRVLTTRIAHIVSTGRARAHEILAVTFTNKAAREMRQRVAVFSGSEQAMPWLGTFHSVGAKILRMHAELVGLRPNFTILDTDDQLRLLKQLLQAENLDDKRWPARALANLIDGWKNRGIDPKSVPASEAAGFAGGKSAALYESYQARLKALNAVDFGDLLLEPLRLLREHSDVLNTFRRRFRYILVDEYQDTNVVQYLLLRLIAQANGNLCCVGDDDQSIYAWRGADVENILRFEKDFPGAKVIRLERNYRSTGHILAVAAGLIAHNRGRLGKTLFTDKPLGDRPRVAEGSDSQEEARLIGEEIEAAQHKGVSLDDIAILVRASFQMREFEERFIALGLPYKVIGGPRFYERAEIRDALAYLRCIAQPDDDLAFERIYNQPKRGLGEATLAILHDYGRRAGLSLTRAARALVETEELKPRPRQILRGVLDDFDRWRRQSEQIPHEELAQLVLEESGYIDMWKAERTPDAAGRLDNLKELVRSMGEFPDLGAFLEHVSLVMDVDSGDEGARVSIMTLHAAKGLEFDLVFLPGWEEGLFPNQRSLDDSGLAGLEEERRLAYVGLTRARRQARIYYALNRRVRGLMADLDSVAVHPGIARRPCRVRRIHRIVGPQLWFVAARGSGNRVCLPLRHARLASRGGAAARVGRSGLARASASRPDFRRLSPQTRLAVLGFPCGIAGVSQQVRAWRRRRRGRPEADGRFRQSGPKTGDGQFRRRGGIGEPSRRRRHARRANRTRRFFAVEPVSTCLRQPWFSD